VVVTRDSLGADGNGYLRVLALLLALVTVVACQDGGNLPTKSSPEYRDAVSAFYLGLTALQTSQDEFAEQQLTKVTQLVPQEPAAWANLGLLALRRQELEKAAERLESARALAPDNSRILFLLSLVESRRGRFAEAIAYLRRAGELDPRDPKASYALAHELERQGSASDDAEPRRLLEKLVEAHPDNLAVRLELARLAAKRGDVAALRQTVARLAEKASSWPAEAQGQLAALQTAASAADSRLAARHVAVLRNVLVIVPAFRQSLAAVSTPREEAGEPILRFTRLPSPSPNPAPPDDALAFAGEPLSSVPTGRWTWTGALSLTDEAAPTVVFANGHEVRLSRGITLPFPGGTSASPPMPNGVAALDFNNDFKPDLVLAGAGGVRLFRQEDGGRFADITGRTTLPTSVTKAPCAGVWAADIESDGDLDILLGAVNGPPIVLRNNGDGTFKELRPFQGASPLRGFAWADLDGDGVPDAALLGAEGTIEVFFNQRAGQFQRRAVRPNPGKVVAINVADVTGDGILDLLAVRDNGAILRVLRRPDAEDWDSMEIAAPATPSASLAVGLARLHVADLDNNGGLDLITSGPSGGVVWLSGADGRFKRLPTSLDASVLSVSDLNGDGRLDLLGPPPPTGQPVRLLNRGTKKYRWQELRPRAAPVPGDWRINSFGIGGEIEIRSALLVQKQPITEPRVHFGLGEHAEAQVVRIVWPNGVLQSEFNLQPNQTVVAIQRLKGSCPWLFAYNGRNMEFITDLLWRSPLGLRINAQDTASVTMTEDWVKIRGDQLVARDGAYDLRITAELWETHFFDSVSLMVVDHPPDTEVFVDERFAVPPPPLAIHQTSRPRPVARAWDDHGRDVTEIVRARDGRYLATFGLGRYQGVAQEHYVEIELGEEAPVRGPLWLIATGWIHPTDSSINVAIGQGHHPPPRGLQLEVPNPAGGWVVARPDLGFPAGKFKTILIDLEGVFRPGTPRRLRLRTNLEVFWDAIQWAPGVAPARVRTQRLPPSVAELRYRGFSAVGRADHSAPELPDYETLAGTRARWLDLTGYHTRFGDVRKLLEKVDDRYVIMNAGDEMVLRFPAAAPPVDGWVRDFVLVSDGWEKDGDFNTSFSKTVLPLPAHGRPDYSTPPGSLQDDPVYRRHARDWSEYHTRYVTPERVRDALRLGEPR